MKDPTRMPKEVRACRVMFPVSILEKNDTSSVRPEPRSGDARNGFSGKLQSMNRNRQREAVGNTSRKVARQGLPKPAGAYIMPPNTVDFTWSHRMLCLPCWVLVLLCSQSYFLCLILSLGTGMLSLHRLPWLRVCLASQRRL